MSRRALYKTLTWRLLASTVTIMIILVLTGRWDLSLIGGGTETLIKTGVYYVHEKVWGD